MAGKHTLDRVVAVVSAVATPVVALLIDTQVISATVGVDIGSIIAALVGGYHGGAVIQRRETAQPERPAGSN